MIEKRFGAWDYHSVQQAEQLCTALPILPRSKAMDFFKQAERVTSEDVKVVERQGGRVFESLSGFVSSSDRKDFTVTYEFAPQSPANGMLMLETFDDVIGLLFCVARISETSFLTHGFTQRKKAAIKGLRDGAPESSSPGVDVSPTQSRKWWQFWK